MKKALVIVAILAVAAAGAGWWAWNSVGFVLKVALEHYGPEVAGVSVQVDGAEFSARDGRGSVKGLEIGSPVGFAARRAARVGEIRFAIDPDTIRQPVVHIRELAVEAPFVTYERGDHGTNLDAIRNNIAAYIERSGGASSGRPAEARRGQRKFVVDLLVIEGGKVTVTRTKLNGQGLTFDLPDIRLHDVGAREGGITASELGNVVASELQERIAQKVLTNIDLLRKGGLEGALDALKGLLRRP